MDNDPARVLGVVFGDSSACELAFTHSGVVGWDRGDRERQNTKERRREGNKNKNCRKVRGEIGVVYEGRDVSPERKRERERRKTNCWQCNQTKTSG